GKRSELPQSGALTGYAQFAAECLVSGNNEQLHAFLEQGGIVDLLSLMSIFKLYQLHREGINGLELSGQDISYLLNSPVLARSYLAGENAQLVYEAILGLALDDAGWYKIGQPSLITLRQQAESDPSLKSSLDGLAQHALLAFNQAWAKSDVPAMSRLLDGVIASLDESLALDIWQHIFSECVSRGPSRRYSVDQWLWFLQGWARLPEATGDQQPIVGELLPWLNLPWSALGEFLKLSMPQRWRKQAVYHVIQRAGSGSVDEQPISEVVAQNHKLFEEVFEHYASSGAHIRASNKIFAKLVDLHYEGKMPLLRAILQGLLTRSAQKLDDGTLQHWTRNLLNNARLSPAELSEFLESDIGQVLQDLLPSAIYNEYLRKYVAELGPEDLQRARCLSLLGRLDRSGGSRDGEPLGLIEGWRAVADVLQGARTIVQKRREKDLVYAARFMPKIMRPEVRQQTHDALIAALVRAVAAKDDVVWIVRQAGRSMGGESQLLAEMTAAAEAAVSDDKHYVSAMLIYLELACSVELSDPARSRIERIIQNMSQPVFNELWQRAENGWSQHAVRQLASERKRLRRSVTGFSTFLKKH
ncbi:MAG: hypothetical protein M3441_01400, partial [Chloroflexota bacterium]|nr:hypothetical protein [Chloroflexota bacterium]MDQ5852669.1 hypothetical protein [Chloroflexota bacterium]